MLFISTRAQSFSADLIVGFLIFTIVLASYYYVLTNLSDEDEAELTRIIYDARKISADLMSEGYPANWSEEDVRKIGILSSSVINETKLNMFYELGYEEAKRKFGTNYDFYVFFIGQDSSVIPLNSSVEGIGKPGVNSTNINEAESPRKLAAINRITVRESNIARMVVYAWS